LQHGLYSASTAEVPLLVNDANKRVVLESAPGTVAASGVRFTKYLTTILRLSYDKMPKLRSTYDGRLIYKTSYNEWIAFHR